MKVSGSFIVLSLLFSLAFSQNVFPCKNEPTMLCAKAGIIASISSDIMRNYKDYFFS